MFDIGWSELLLIGIVALIAIGPKELPGALRTLGQWMAKVRRMAAEFQNQFHEAMREAELADLRKEVDEMTAKAQSYAHFDPIEDIRRDVENAASPPPALDAPVTEQLTTQTAAAAPPPAGSPGPGTPPASETLPADAAALPPPAAAALPPPADAAAPPPPAQETAPAAAPDPGRAA